MDRSFKEFRDKGILWALNRHVFHPRGYSIGFTYDETTREVTGWLLLKSSSGVFTFDMETDDSGFKRFEAFLKGEGNG